MTIQRIHGIMFLRKKGRISESMQENNGVVLNEYEVLEDMMIVKRSDTK